MGTEPGVPVPSGNSFSLFLGERWNERSGIPPFSARTSAPLRAPTQSASSPSSLSPVSAAIFRSLPSSASAPSIKVSRWRPVIAPTKSMAVAERLGVAEEPLEYGIHHGRAPVSRVAAAGVAASEFQGATRRGADT